MKYFTLAALVVQSLFCFSQINEEPTEIHFLPTQASYISLNGDKSFKTNDDLKLYLESKYLKPNISNQSLQLAFTKRSPIGTHIRFDHFINNKPVFQSFIQASFNLQGQLILIATSVDPFFYIDVNHYLPEKEELWINTNFGLRPGYKVSAWDSINKNYRTNYYDVYDQLILSHNPQLYLHSPDSIVSAMVYLPNPIVATNQNYGGPYSDNGDKTNAELTNARAKVNLKLKFNNGKFELSDSLIQLKDLNAPNIEVIQPTDSFLNYTRDQSGFEDVNVFYHLSNYSTYLKKIGFSNLLDSLLVDPHGASGDDNSFLEPEKYPYQIEYGTGNVDDGEDGQVVVHEFGHTLSVIASPKTTFGADRLAMEEGQADYVSMTYSRSLSPNKPNQVFSWDGHNEFWTGFKTNVAMLYKNRKGNTDIDREIWSTALMCIHDKLRNTKSDSLIFSSYYLQTSNSSMPQMARIILKIDSLLFSGKDVGKVWQCFTDQGILDSVPANIGLPAIDNTPIKFKNTYAFSQGIGKATLVFANPKYWQDIEIYNSLGQKIRTIAIDKEIILSPEDFQSGIYYIKIKSAQGLQHTISKLIRY